MSAQYYREVNFCPGRVGLFWDGVIDDVSCLTVYLSFHREKCVFIFHRRDLSHLTTV